MSYGLREGSRPTSASPHCGTLGKPETSPTPSAEWVARVTLNPPPTCLPLGAALRDPGRWVESRGPQSLFSHPGQRSQDRLTWLSRQATVSAYRLCAAEESEPTEKETTAAGPGGGTWVSAGGDSRPPESVMSLAAASVWRRAPGRLVPYIRKQLERKPSTTQRVAVSCPGHCPMAFTLS